MRNLVKALLSEFPLVRSRWFEGEYIVFFSFLNYKILVFENDEQYAVNKKYISAGFINSLWSFWF